MPIISSSLPDTQGGCNELAGLSNVRREGIKLTPGVASGLSYFAVTMLCARALQLSHGLYQHPDSAAASLHG